MRMYSTKDLSSCRRQREACNLHNANIDDEILINSKTFDEQTSIGNICT